MGRARPADFDFAAAVGEVSFTPGVRDFPSLVALLDGDEALSAKVERALLRAGEPAVRYAVAAFVGVEKVSLRARICRLVGRYHAERSGVAAQGAKGNDEGEGGSDEDDAPLRFLLTRLGDGEPQVRRSAIRALGKERGRSATVIEAALLGLLDVHPQATALPAEDLRAVVAALGKVGGPRALSRLSSLAMPEKEDAELLRLLAEARLLLERRGSRSAPARDAAPPAAAGSTAPSTPVERERAPLPTRAASSIDATRSVPGELAVALHCRTGVEQILVEECAAAWGARAVGPGRVEARFSGRLDGIWRCRTLLSLGFLLADEPVSDGKLAEAVARALTSPPSLALLRALSTGAPRYRLAWGDGGRRRAEVFRVAQAVSLSQPELVNDPSERGFEVVVHERGADGRAQVSLELRPRLDDPRFVYRKRDVPAASHPTLAAALVRVAGVRADDAVWDPFVGSGTELVERALAGPYRDLVGTDHDARALEAARANLDAAGVRGARLVFEDGLSFPAKLPSLVITNPPMGRRVLRQKGLGDLCDRLVDRVAHLLVPGGRLCWISPLPSRTAERATRAGLVTKKRQLVDMGGFDGEIQLFVKP